MCWESKNLKIKTAKKDISVWKIVYLPVDNSPNKCCSFFKNFVYIKDVLKTTSIYFRVRNNGIEGNMGFHSYSNKLKWEMDHGSIYVYKKRIFSNLKDSIEVYEYYPDTRVAKFHIPAGAKYAKNKDGEIISSAIVFDNFID
ncbi:MAG: hypothetical protein MR346_06965 [Clostridium sp.]|nr:hypothetical protein [Clostridium sp.]